MRLVLTLAGAWPITEWLRGTMFTGFPWNPLGVTLADTHCSTSPRVIGTYGLSMLVVIAGGMLWLLVAQTLASRRRRIVGFTPRLALQSPTAATRRRRAVATDPRRSSPTSASRTNGGQGFAEKPRGGWRRCRPGPARDPRLLFWPEAAVTDPLEDARTGEHQAFAEFERTRAAALRRARRLSADRRDRLILARTAA